MPTHHPDTKQAFTVDPFASASSTPLLIKPVVYKKSCQEPLQIKVLVNGTPDSIKELWYQEVGRGANQRPRKAHVNFHSYSPSDDEDQFIGDYRRSSENISETTLTIDQDDSQDVYVPMNRIVVFGLDRENKMVADSSVFLVDCLEDSIMLNLSSNSKSYEMQISGSPNTVCAVEISNSEKRNQLTAQKINKLLEQFDVNTEAHFTDKCSRKQSTATDYNQSVPSRHYQVVDYKSELDAFNNVGLTASSSDELDSSPCEDKIFPNGVPEDTIAGRDQIQPLLNWQSNRDDYDFRNIIQLERSLLDDLIYWNVMSTTKESGQLQRRFSNSDQNEQLHGSAVCVDPAKGLRLSRSQAQPSNQRLAMRIDAPQDLVRGETAPIKVYLQNRNNNGCLKVI